MSQSDRRDRRLFLLLCAGCVLATIAFGIVTARRSKSGVAAGVARKDVVAEAPKTVSAEPGIAGLDGHSSSPPSPKEPARSETKNTPQVGKSLAATLVSKPASPLVFFRANALGANYGKLSVAAFDALDQPRYAAELSCDRVHFAGDRGVCLASDRGVFTTYYAVMFDEHLERGRTIALDGIPSRVRVSPSGRLAAITVFLSGHSYADLHFSTRTTITDAASGQILADLEKFSVSRNGAAFESPDFNFWGVTFAHDENRFYATLWSKSKIYLVEGDLRKRTARVIYEGVECPSLSPDNARIAFKKRVGAPRFIWQIHLLDLTTLTETALGETRSVDDQVEWLDNEQILYALSESEKGSSASTDIWVLPATTGGTPRLLLRGGFSPAVVPRKN